MLRSVIIGICIFVLLIVTVFIVFGLIYSPKETAVIINPQSTSGGAICQQEAIKCETNADCAVCVDDVEMTCQPLSRYSSDQEKLFGKNGKYCLPEIPRSPCNEKNGGVQVWTGWSDTERMEFDCMCTYPDYFGGDGCMDINANVCSGNNSSFDFDARTSTAPPGPANCKCPPGTNIVVRQIGQIPTCVPDKVFTSYYSGTEEGGPISGCGPG